MNKKINIILILMAVTLSPCTAQVKGIVVKKASIKDKHRIVLSYDNDSVKLETYEAGCAMKKFTFLPDEIKIRAIEELLTFENDTSICAYQVIQYNSSYFKNKKPVSKKYTLQIDALYYINYLAFSGASLFYSPFPVLYDTLTKKEVNLSKHDIKQVYAEYKKWFEGIKKTGFKNYTFPLNNSKYQWFGTVKQNSLFLEYPVWTNTDGCKFWNE